MATKKTLPEWDYALTQLRKSQPSNIPGMEMEEKYYFPRLKFSYDNLRKDKKIRECFLCCSLWPEDYEIEKEELIMCWMGLEYFIDGFGDIKQAYDEGYSLIGSLTVASLLEPVREDEYVIKMHDVIRDLALWIARDSGTNINKWLVKAGVGLKEVHSEVAKWEEVEWISLMENRIKELPRHLSECHNLSTLILQENRELVGIPGGVFTCMPNLTYLDLSRTGLHDISKEICHLKKLRYLNLSYTKISTLPEELGQLGDLKYLLLRYTRVLVVGEVIRRIIGKLLKLEYLDLYPYLLAETDGLPPLLKGVGMKITSEYALQQLSRVVPPILDLAIEDMGGDSSTTSINLHQLLSSRTQQSLRELRFVRCRSIRRLVVDFDVCFPSLKRLELRDLENLTEIVWRRRSVVPPSECFQRLRYLTIKQCHGLKDITWVLHLPFLDTIHLLKCDEMEQLVVIGGGEERERVTKATFPRLRWLVLRDLPKLAMICDNHAAAAAAAAVNFPSLEMFNVRGCNELKQLPFHPQLPLNNCSRLKHIYGERGWWERMEWEDQSAQSYLQPYFRALY